MGNGFLFGSGHFSLIVYSVFLLTASCQAERRPQYDWYDGGAGVDGKDSPGAAHGDTDVDGDGDVGGDIDGDGDSDGDSDGAGNGDGDSDGDVDSDGDADADADTDGDSDSDVDKGPSGSLATGLQISSIAFYQSVKIPLMEGGQEVAGRPVKVVAEKDGLLRIFVTRKSGFQARRIRAVAEFQSGGKSLSSLESEITVSADSSENQLQTTFNIAVPAEYLSGNLKYRVSLLETSSGVPAGSSSGASWPASGMASLGEQNMGGALRVILIPVRYNADGSGRLPDVSDKQLDLYADAFYALYPAAEVEITVASALAWNSDVSAMNGSGWSQLLSKIQGMRSQVGATNKDYVYGLFKPASSFAAYCGYGCIAGLSTVATRTTDSWARASIGLGFTGADAAWTMVHEVGHAHGRNHAPCGQGVSGIDSQYPHTGASTGKWGYDLLSKTLKTPSTHKDIMSYCQPQWVSDYTYDALYNRIRAVNALNYLYLPDDFPREWMSIGVDGEGQAHLGPSFQLDAPPGGKEVTVLLLDSAGQPVETTSGFFSPYSHIGGGQILFPSPKGDIAAVEVEGSHPIWL